MARRPLRRIEPQQFRSLRLVMVGDGPLRAEAQAVLAQSGVEELAWLPGGRADESFDAGGALVLHLDKPEAALLRLTPRIEKDGAVSSWACRVETENPQWFPANCRP